MTEVDKAFLKYYGLDDSEIEHAEEEWNFREEDNYDLFKAGADCRQAEIDALKERIEKMKCCIEDLVYLGEFNENTVEEYLNYQVHEALKNAEQFIKE